MKKVYITIVIAVISISAVAQNRTLQNRGFMGANPAQLVPQLVVENQLTTEQQESINALRIDLRKELLQLDNQLAEKRVQLRSLQQVEKPRIKSINSKIDEITDLQNKRMKLIAQNQINIRELLTEEQRLAYDLRMSSGTRGANRGAMNSRRPMNQKGSINQRGGLVNPRGVMN